MPGTRFINTDKHIEAGAKFAAIILTTFATHFLEKK